MEGCYSINQSCGLKLNIFLHQMIPQKSDLTHNGALHNMYVHPVYKQILSSYVLCKQLHVCALSWEAEQEAEQQTVPFLPSFEEGLCFQVSQAALAPGVQQLSLMPTGAVSQTSTLSPGTSTPWGCVSPRDAMPLPLYCGVRL